MSSQLFAPEMISANMPADSRDPAGHARPILYSQCRCKEERRQERPITSQNASLLGPSSDALRCGERGAGWPEKMRPRLRALPRHDISSAPDTKQASSSGSSKSHVEMYPGICIRHATAVACRYFMEERACNFIKSSSVGHTRKQRTHSEPIEQSHLPSHTALYDVHGCRRGKLPAESSVDACRCGPPPCLRVRRCFRCSQVRKIGTRRETDSSC